MSLGSDAPGVNVLPLVIGDDVVAHLEALLAEMGGAASEALVTFDADGTLLERRCGYRRL